VRQRARVHECRKARMMMADYEHEHAAVPQVREGASSAGLHGWSQHARKGTSVRLCAGPCTMTMHTQHATSASNGVTSNPLDMGVERGANRDRGSYTP
jgi:hypothetical protein